MSRRLLAIAFVTGLVGFAFFAFQLPNTYLAPLALVSVAALLYNAPLGAQRRLRDFGWLKPLWLADCWLAVCYAVPQAVQGAWDSRLLLSRGLFFLALALVFDARDADFDRGAGVVTLSAKLGSHRTHFVAAVLFAGSVLVDLTNAELFAATSWATSLVASGLVATVLAVSVAVSQPRQTLWLYEGAFDGLVALPAAFWLVLR